MTIAFTFSAASLNRLAALRHAVDTSTRSQLAHIHLQVDGDAARFLASNGRLLALLKLVVGDVDGDATTVLLDGALFTAACATLAKADYANRVRIVIDHSDREARLIRGSAVAVVPLLDLVYPISSSFLERYSSGTMVPAIATFAPSLLSTGVKIIGDKNVSLMLWSPSPDGNLARCWANADDVHTPIARNSIATLLHQPGIWSNGLDLVLLLMPVTRVCTGTPEIAPFIASSTVSELAVTAA